MANCPQCQVNLSQDDLKALRCSQCGYAWSVDEAPADVVSQDASAEPAKHWSDDHDDGGATVDVREMSSQEIQRLEQIWATSANQEASPGMTIKARDDQFLDDDFDKSGASRPSAGSPHGDSATGDSEKTIANPARQAGDAPFRPEAKDTKQGSPTDEVSPPASSESADDDEWSADSHDVTLESDVFVDESQSADNLKTLFDTDSQDDSEEIDPDSKTFDSENFVSEQASDDDHDSYDQTIVSDEFEPPDAKTFESDDSVQENFDEMGATIPDVASFGTDSPEDEPADQTILSDSFEIDESGSADHTSKTDEFDAPGSAASDDDSYDQTIVSDEFGPDSKTFDSKNQADFSDDRTAPMDAGDLQSTVSSGGLVIKRRSLRLEGTLRCEDADYVLMNLLGEGGMGKVYNARQTSVDRSVAVKMLKVKSKKLREQQAKFLTEAVVTGDLAHPNIVPIYDVGQDEEDALFYSMKHVTGNPWIDTLRQKPLEKNLDILMRVADAMAFAHSKGVVHRDLKPENVMLGEFGEVLVMDWGLAMPTDEFSRGKRGITRTNSMGGTPAYMAPEMATGPLKSIGPASDVYLMGAMLYEIITGAPPHRGKNAMKCLMSAAKNIIHPTNEDGELMAIAMRAMSTNPRERHSSVHEFRTAVEDYLTHSESYELSDRAEDDLKEARETGNYQTFNKAVFGFEEALRLWSGNKTAISGLAATQLAYAEQALANSDFDLAGSLLDDDEPDHKPILATIAKSKKERDERIKKLKRAKQIGYGLVATILLVVSAAFLWVNAARAEAEERRIAAEASERRAEGSAAIADFNAIEAGIQERKALDNLEIAEAAKEAEAVQARLAAGEAAIAFFNAIEAQAQKKQTEQALLAAKLAQAAEEKQARIAAGEAVIADFNSVQATVQQRKAEIAQLAEAIQRKRAAGEAVVAFFNSIEAQAQRKKAEIARLAEVIQTRKAGGEAALSDFNAVQASVQERKAVAAQQAESVQRKRAAGEAVVAFFNSIEAQAQRKQAEIARVAEEIQTRKAGGEAALSDFNAVQASVEERKAVAAQQAESVQRKLAAGEAVIAFFNSIEAQAQRKQAEIARAAEEIQSRLAAGSAALSDFNAVQASVEEQNARVQEKRAVAEEKKALANLDLALTERKRADGEATIAQFNAIEASVQERMAQVQRARAEEERNRAIAARQAQEYEAYGALIGLAKAKIEENSFDFARVLLNQTNASFRNWEWGYLMHLCSQSEREFEQENRVESIDLFHDSDRFAIGGAEGLARIQNRLDKEDVQDISLPASVNVLSVAVSPDDRFVALGTDDTRDGFIKLWDVAEEEFVETAFGPRDIFAVPGNEDQRMALGHLNHVVSVEFSRDGRFLLTASMDRTARLWNVENGNLIRIFDAHSDWVWDATFASSESDLETQIITVSEDGTAVVWRDPTGQWTDEDNVSFLLPFRGHTGPVYSVACSPDGQTVATGGYDRKILVWQPQDIPQLSQREYFAKLYRNEPVPRTKFTVLAGHSAPVKSVSFADTMSSPFNDSQDFVVVLSGANDNLVKVWKVPRGTTSAQITPQVTFKGHGGWVRDCVFSPDGKWILSTGHDRFVRQFSTDDNAEDAIYLVDGPELGGHTDSIEDVAITIRDGERRVATVSRDKTVKVYNLNQNDADEEPTETLTEGHSPNASVPSGVFLSDGRTFVSAASDATTRVWDLTSGTQLMTLEGTGDGAALAVSTKDGRWILTGGGRVDPEKDSSPWQAKLWDISKMASSNSISISEPLVSFAEHPTPINAVAISNNTNANGQLTLLTADRAGRIQLWSWKPGTKTVTLLRAIAPFEGKYAHKGAIVAAKFLPGDDIAVTAGADNVVSLWNVASGSELENRRMPHSGPIYSMNVTPDGSRLVTSCADGKVRVWDLANAELERIYAPRGGLKTFLSNVKQEFRSKRHSAEIMERAWQIVNEDEDLADFRERGGWNQNVVDLLYQLPKRVAQSAANANLSTDSATTEALLAKEFAEQFADEVFEGVTADSLLRPRTGSVAISPDGRIVLATNSQDAWTYLWNVEDTTAENAAADQRLNANGRLLQGVMFSPESGVNRFALLGLGDARVYTIEKGFEDRSKVQLVMSFNAHDQIVSADFAPDGLHLVASGMENSARVWDVKQRRTVVKLEGAHTAPVLNARYSPDGKLILTVSADGTAKLWSIETVDVDGEKRLKATVEHSFIGHTSDVTDGAFSPDGKTIVTVSKDRMIRLWNAKTGESLFKSPAEEDALLCVDFCGDGQRIVVGHNNRIATLWSMENADGKTSLTKRMMFAGHSAAVTDVVFSPLEDFNENGQQDEFETYGDRMMSASEDNSVIVWDTRIPKLSEDKLPSAKQILTLRRHTRAVTSVRFAPDGRLAVTGSEDTRAILWPTKDWRAEKRAKLVEEKSSGLADNFELPSNVNTAER